MYADQYLCDVDRVVTTIRRIVSYGRVLVLLKPAIQALCSEWGRDFNILQLLMTTQTHSY